MIYMLNKIIFFFFFQKNITDRLRNNRGQVKLKEEEKKRKSHENTIKVRLIKNNNTVIGYGTCQVAFFFLLEIQKSDKHCNKSDPRDSQHGTAALAVITRVSKFFTRFCRSSY